MRKMNFTVACVFFVLMLVLGCAGTEVSKFSYNENLKINEPIKGEGCYDASVLLGENLSRSKDIAKKVFAALDTTISEETPTSIKAQRNRHIGLLVGSGGEELAVNLKEVDSKKIFVTATTKTGFVGGAGQKAWSCQIIDEMIKMASK